MHPVTAACGHAALRPTRPAECAAHRGQTDARCAPLRQTEPLDPGANRSPVPGGHTGRPYGRLFVGLGQHRTIWQEHSAKDFASYESYKRAGILYVFPPFITARMGQKIGRRPQTQLCGDALEKVYHIPGEMETFSLGTAKMGLTAGVAYGIMASPVKKGLFFLPFSFRGNSISLPGCGREAKLRRCRTCASKSL